MGVVNKKILFLNPAKNDSFFVDRIHMGFTLMGQILTEAGCAVKVMDYAYLKTLATELKIPSIRELIRDFNPDVIDLVVMNR